VPWALLIILIVTNPSISAFKAYRGRDSYEGLRKSSNWFVFSIYREHANKYLAILGNFFFIEPRSEQPELPILKDSSAIDTSRKGI